MVGGGDPVALAESAARRVRHVRLKDVDAGLVQRVVSGALGYEEAVRRGLYRPLGEGDVNLRRVLELLEDVGCEGWYVLEQDASGFARQRNRLQTFACTNSIGPGATNMVTGAALATINRLPVLLLPGDVFASRAPDPILQQLETPHDGMLSVNDCFRAVSKYWNRIDRPEQIIPAALAAMRVMTNKAETGAVTLALAQDVQAEACEFPEEFLRRRVWSIGRQLPEAGAMGRAVELIREARRPMIVAGGGVIYSAATEVLKRFAERTGIPVGETQAGKGSLPYDHPSALGAVGATGTFAANRVAREADLVIGVGTHWTDFTTASKSAFQNPEVSFININVADFDAHKHSGLALVGDARATLEALNEEVIGYEVAPEYREQAARSSREWDRGVGRLYNLDHGPLPAQSEVIGAVNTSSEPEDVVVCAAGSMPGASTSSGAPAIRRATTSSTASRAWATRSPAGSASRWQRRSARSS
jgi:3D-(3,5/4)-trihydroxycyclohexane-1,2-dione acylhydrolase (decyclizing)